jgi:hypothetical protein
MTIQKFHTNFVHAHIVETAAHTKNSLSPERKKAGAPNEKALKEKTN